MKIACTQCGADIDIKPDEEFLVCPYCKTALYVDLGRTVLTKTAKPIVTAEQAVRSLRDLLSANEIAGTRIDRVEMVYIPYWQLEIGGRTLLLLACGLPMVSLQKPGIPQTAELVDTVDGSGARELLPDIPLDQILASIDERGGAKEPERAAIFKVPFYRIDYTHQTGSFEAYVDGIVGGVFYDDLPPSQSTKLDRYFGAVMGFSFAALFAAALAASSPLVGLVTTGAAGAVLYAILRAWTGRGNGRG